MNVDLRDQYPGDQETPPDFTYPKPLSTSKKSISPLRHIYTSVFHISSPETHTSLVPASQSLRQLRQLAMLARPRLHVNLASRIHTVSSHPVVIYPYRALATMALQPRFSKDTDDTTASSAVEALVSSGEGTGGRWTLTKEGEALERTFKFKTFAKTWVPLPPIKHSYVTRLIVIRTS
jgi:hypothetical protein